jgi:hypothetical protein
MKRLAIILPLILGGCGFSAAPQPEVRVVTLTEKAPEIAYPDECYALERNPPMIQSDRADGGASDAAVLRALKAARDQLKAANVEKRVCRSALPPRPAS